VESPSKKLQICLALCGNDHELATKALNLSLTDKNAWGQAKGLDETPNELKLEYDSYSSGGYGNHQKLSLGSILGLLLLAFF
jgi:hypothetical protein